MTLTLRAPGRDEVGAITALVNELGQSLHGEDHTDEAHVDIWFTAASMDPERDVLVAENGDGGLDGAAAIIDPAEDHAVLWLRMYLHPERGSAELGDRLLVPLERRARELGTDRSLIHAGCASLDLAAHELFERHGYRIARHFFRMVIDLDAPPPAPVWPDGFEVRTVDVERDLELVHQTDEEVFADNWVSVRTSFADWSHYMTSIHFDPSLWFLAWAGDEIAGVSLCNPQQGGDTGLGWVNVLGVRRPWRRQGLARALLLHSFGEFHRRGLKRAGLGVDTDSTTGALRLYEQVGMRVVRQFDVWEKPVSQLPTVP